MKKSIVYPDDKIENSITDFGRSVCGIDEVGRGAWAGPLVLAAVIPGRGIIDGVRDSKLISPKRRKVLSEQIYSWARSVGIGEVGNTEIDKYGLSQSLTLGAKRALDNALDHGGKIDVILLDGPVDFICNSRFEVRTIPKGDNISHAIACASIVAKVYRDELMSSEDIAGKFEDFAFGSNKGYPSPVHREALKTLGPTPLHRISWNILGESFPKTRQEALL